LSSGIRSGVTAIGRRSLIAARRLGSAISGRRGRGIAVVITLVGLVIPALKRRGESDSCESE